MNDQQMSGRWTGVYTYGEEYDDPIKGKTVPFEMELSVMSGEITGKCTDAESTAHFQQPATIEGAVHNNAISFVKRYPHYWQHEKDGPRYLPKLPSQEIVYTGRFLNDRFEGEWEIITALVDSHGEMVSYRSYGQWFMTKVA